jgi:hypothetical protein
MLQRNEVWVGIVVGILLPAVCFTILYQLFGLLEARGAASGTGLPINFRERTLALIAVVTNLLPLQIYRGRRWDDAMRGVVIATSVLALVWVLRYGSGLF